MDEKKDDSSQLRVDKNRASCRAQEGNLRGGDLENGLALIFPLTMKNIQRA